MNIVRRQLLDKILAEVEEMGGIPDFRENLIRAFKDIDIEHYEIINDYTMVVLSFKSGERHVYIGIPNSHPLHYKNKEEDLPVFELDGGKLFSGLIPFHCPNIALLFGVEKWIIGSLYCENENHILDADLIKNMNTEEDANELLFKLSTNVNIDNKKPVATLKYVVAQGNKLFRQLRIIEER